MRLLSVNSEREPASKVATLEVRSRCEGDSSGDDDPFVGLSVLTSEHYRYWQERFGLREGGFGRFGEDLTVEGMPEDRVHVGDVFRIGTAMFEITRPWQTRPGREPGPGPAEWSRLMQDSDRVGFFLRVLIGGRVRAGEEIERVKVDPLRMTVRRVHEIRHSQRKNVEAARRAISIPALSPSWRREFQAIVEAADRNPRGDIGCCKLPV
jgi:MOSC domain-containing protein YiiM